MLRTTLCYVLSIRSYNIILYILLEEEQKQDYIYSCFCSYSSWFRLMVPTGIGNHVSKRLFPLVFFFFGNFKTKRKDKRSIFRWKKYLSFIHTFIHSVSDPPSLDGLFYLSGKLHWVCNEQDYPVYFKIKTDCTRQFNG